MTPLLATIEDPSGDTPLVSDAGEAITRIARSARGEAYQGEYWRTRRPDQHMSYQIAARPDIPERILEDNAYFFPSIDEGQVSSSPLAGNWVVFEAPSTVLFQAAGRADAIEWWRDNGRPMMAQIIKVSEMDRSDVIDPGR